jgi:hypothetical protein
MMKSLILLVCFITVAGAAQSGAMQGARSAAALTDSALSEVFPLSVGNQWVYHYSYYYGDYPGPITHYDDTGTVKLQVIGVIPGADSIRWSVQQDGVHWTNTNFAGWYGPSTRIDTFEIIEINKGNHELYRRGELRTISTSVLPFMPDFPDSAKIHRYAKVDSSGEFLMTITNFFRFKFKRNIGLTEVSSSSGYTGWPYWGTNHSLLTSIITDVPQALANQLPRGYVLSQNYPNPFNPSTTISISLPSRSPVLLKIFDLLGRHVATLVAEELPAGTHTRRWNASGMPSGVYFYRLQAGAYSETKRLLLLK